MSSEISLSPSPVEDSLGEEPVAKEAGDIVIRVKNLSKIYQIYDQPEDRLKQSIYPRFQRLIGRQPKNYYREFWALKDISFEVKKGETLGIIGRNGAGKSTLLQIIAGTLHPSGGEVETNGRVAALLELGSGFNPEFTGRENVYMNATILGLSKEEIDAKLDNIVAFADIGDFIEQPVKSYSSGMMVRLAFAVIVHVDADILVIDEALAVGDAFFQQKCMRFLRNFQKFGGIILFVTHDIGSVLSLCNKALLLFSGGVTPPNFGEAEDICKLYLEDQYDAQPVVGSRLELSESEPKARTDSVNKFQGNEMPETIYIASEFRPMAESFGKKEASVIDAGFFDEYGHRLSTIKGEQSVNFIIKAKMHSRVAQPVFGFVLKNNLGEYLYTEGTDLPFKNQELVCEEGDIATATFAFTMPHLIRGKYLMLVAFAEGIGDDHVMHHLMYDAIELEVISSRLVHGYSGMNNIEMYIDILSQNISAE